jgi:iron complex outermembrane receptor protein
MRVSSPTGLRRSLFTTSALVAPSLAVAFALPVWLAPERVQAQSATTVPPVVVEVQKPKPRAQRPRVSTPRQARQPASALSAGTQPAASTPAGLSVPANTATITGEAAFSRGLGTSDSAALVEDIPGGATWGAGGVSSLPALNGMGADRVQVAINSMLISPACPNEMNPPLSFINPAMITKMQAYVGVSPVSVGGDYTAGKIVVETAPQFASGPAWTTTARISGFSRSISNGYGVDASATVANADTAISYSGGWAHADNYRAGNGSIVKSTKYETQNHMLMLAKRNFGNQFTVQLGGQFIPYQGYVNQYMDMIYNRSFFANGKYEGVFDWGKLEASAFTHQIRHTMGFIQPDKTGMMPMDTRASDVGYSVKATILATRQDTLRIGNELLHNRLSDWWDPVAGSMMMGPNVFWNINDGTRTRLGTFVEWEHRWNRQWTTLVGLRNDMVWMNTGNVQAYNSSMMMFGMDAANFNARNHARTDANLDGSAILRFEPDQQSVFELGFARKTRSPNLYERYAWSTNTMAMRMNGWFGDGNGYVGNLDVKPEKAHTISFTAGWHDAARKDWELRITPYYTYVQDYIDVDKCVSPAMGGMMANCAATGTATNNFVFLKFANHDAWLYGVNIAGKVTLMDSVTSGRVVMRGTFGYVRGQRTDGVNLYHVMPINAKLALDHTLGGWTNGIELQMVGAKDQVSQVRNELMTPAYALINLRSGYQWKNVRIDAGIDNLFNQMYWLPLGGADLADHKNPMGMGYIYGFNVPGPGRSLNGRLTVSF